MHSENKTSNFSARSKTNRPSAIIISHLSPCNHFQLTIDINHLHKRKKTKQNKTLNNCCHHRYKAKLNHVLCSIINKQTKIFTNHPALLPHESSFHASKKSETVLLINKQLCTSKKNNHL